MPDALYPIVDASDEVVRYAVRDFRGVETPASAPASRRGWNLEVDFAQRLDAAIYNEHDANGAHYTLKIALATLFYDTVIDDDSEDRGTVHGDSSRFTVNRTGAGIYEITLTSALPGATLEIVSLPEDENDPSGDFVRYFLMTRTSTTKFTIGRWAGPMGSMGEADGEFLITVRVI